jgi:hypothetical protein
MRHRLGTVLLLALMLASVGRAAPLESPGPTTQSTPKNAPIVNVLDFGATPDDDTDDTAAIQAAIDALPTGFVTGSSRARRGGIVFMPAGRYRIGGVPGRCTGAAQHAPCRDDRPCTGGPPAGSCAALTSGGHQLRMIGAGPYGTELLMVGSNDMDGIAISAGDDFSAIESLRLAKISEPKVGAGNGIVVQGQRTTLRDLVVHGWGAAGVFINGEQGVAKANSCRIDRVESDGNGGDGFHIWSHYDGSMHTVTGCDAQNNDGFGFRIRASKSVFLGLETNGNRAGAVLLAGSHNLVTSYFEIANQPTCITFDEHAEANVVFDMSGCASKAGKLLDRGHNNEVHVDGAWTAMRWLPTEAAEPCDAARRGRVYYDDSLRKLCFCEQHDSTYRWCPVDGSACHGTPAGCD